MSCDAQDADARISRFFWLVTGSSPCCGKGAGAEKTGRSCPAPASAGTAHVGPVLHGLDDAVPHLVDQMHDPVAVPARAVPPGQLELEGVTHPLRVRGEGAVPELDHRGGRLLRGSVQ